MMIEDVIKAIEELRVERDELEQQNKQLKKKLDKAEELWFKDDKLNKYKQALQLALDTLLWLSPCGQCEPPPTYKLIGQKARQTIADIKKIQEQSK